MRKYTPPAVVRPRSRPSAHCRDGLVHMADRDVTDEDGQERVQMYCSALAARGEVRIVRGAAVTCFWCLAGYSPWLYWDVLNGS